MSHKHAYPELFLKELKFGHFDDHWVVPVVIKRLALSPRLLVQQRGSLPAQTKGASAVSSVARVAAESAARSRSHTRVAAAADVCAFPVLGSVHSLQRWQPQEQVQNGEVDVPSA